jgi:uncharacterized protein YndB with AHSA1/START domain
VTTANPATTGVFKVYIRATAEAIWQAITDPDWTVRYGYGGYAHYDLRPGGALRHLPDEKMQAAAAEYGFPCPDVIVDGEVLEVEPPRLLKTTWRMLMDPTTTAEGFTTITYEIKELDVGYCSLTVIHECENAPATLYMVSGSGEAVPNEGGGGHPWILSDLKSLLETGKGLAG